MSENGNTNESLEAASEQRFFRIGQVCRLTDIKSFTLRYWESEFPSLAPVKSSKGQRLYRREDVETVLRIKRLLYDEGFTIAGARRYLRDLDNGAPKQSAASHIGENESPDELRALLDDQPAAPGQDDDAISQFAGSSASMQDQVPASDVTSSYSAAPYAAGRTPAPSADVSGLLSRKLLLDLRDSLRAFLTLLENE